MADIEVLPGREWNAHAALHDALNLVDYKTPLIVLWITEDGRVCQRSSAIVKDVLWMLEVEKIRTVGQ